MQTYPFRLDRIDRAILAVVQEDNRTPQRVIGERVNLSAAAVQRRLDKMKAAGVIRSNVAVIEPSAVGRPITAIVEVELESERAAQVDDAKKAFASAAEVQQCYYVTGEADFILVVTVATMDDYELLTRRLFFDNPNVKRFRTFVAMNRVKAGLSVPVSDA